MGIFFLVSWILGMVLTIFSAILAWVSKNKNLWETIPYMFLVALLTGYITTIPIICAIVILSLNKRFE